MYLHEKNIIIRDEKVYLTYVFQFINIPLANGLAKPKIYKIE